jgi:hypothetical protein
MPGSLNRSTEGLTTVSYDAPRLITEYAYGNEYRDSSAPPRAGFNVYVGGVKK